MRNNPVIPTSASMLKVVSFKQFLSQVPTLEIEPNAADYIYRTLTMAPSWASFDPQLTPDCGEYYDVVVPLIAGNHFKASLLSEARGENLFKVFPKDALWRLVESASAEAAEIFSFPTLLVRIQARHWFLANPDDFRIVFNSRGAALACFRRNALIVYNVEKLG